MKFFTNLNAGLKIIGTIKKYNFVKGMIAEAREEGDYEKEREILGKYSKEWIHDLMEKMDTHVIVTGRENIPEGPCVFISNHQSYADIFAMIYALDGKQVGFIAKEDLRKVPVVGKWIELIRGLYIKRGNPKEALKTIKLGIDYLSKGFSLGIFPEGTRSRGVKTNEFKSGSFKLATKAKVPVVPITVDGGYKVYEETGKFTYGQTIRVIIHKPIETKDLTRKEAAELHIQVEKIIVNSLKEIHSKGTKGEN